MKPAAFQSHSLFPGGAASWLLLPLSGLYRFLTAMRRLAYRAGWLRTHRAQCLVISVGNLTVGGNGKTPLAEYLLREAQKNGAKVVSISRGYGRRNRTGLIRVRTGEGAAADPEAMGDEPAMLAQRNPEVPVYVGKNRVQAARLAWAWDHPELIVLDDGYQHLRLARDLNLVLIDASQGFGNGRLLPRGPLREPLSCLDRSDAILITKANLGQPGAVREALHSLRYRKPVFECEYLPDRLENLETGDSLPLSSLKESPVNLVCAIAHPDGFSRTLVQLGANVQSLTAHPDHHPYGPEQLEKLDRLLEMAGEASGREGRSSPQWVTTSKDAVKLKGRLKHGRRLWVLEMALIPEPAAKIFFFDFIRQGRINFKATDPSPVE